MARHESDREDILREATALVERVALTDRGFLALGFDEVVAGFRRDGSPSFFFGADVVYQFNATNELRRAFADGLLYKAEGGRLVSLRRERTEQETALVRRMLSPQEAADLCGRMEAGLAGLQLALESGRAKITGQVPAAGDVIGRVQTWLRSRPPVPIIAGQPNVSG